MVYKLPKDAIGQDLDADNISANLIASWVPINGIIMWAGTVAEAELLPNWQICDGTNGTPDLRDKFVMGVGSTANASTAAVDDEGGSADAVVVNHTHNVQDNGAHNHSFKASNRAGDEDAWSNNNKGFIGDDDGNVFTQAADTNKIYDGGTHSHTIDNPAGGESGTGKNIPPYFALCYLMRTT
tara:strand:+ start:615 stop:1163 length:549 start_codon:yes stop_codon:yes gene_type:complete